MEPYIRKPPWLKVRIPGDGDFSRIKNILSEYRLHSVCREAQCPNMAECFSAGTATFLILGNACTRNCRYCNIRHGTPEAPDPDEPMRLARASSELGLKYIVVTSVTRDDLTDGGAAQFAATINALHEKIADCRVEALIPDLKGNWRALAAIVEADPAVVNHNIEIAGPLFSSVRPEGDYGRSLELLERVNDLGLESKSGLMIGFGETRSNILETLDDLLSVNCRRLTIGQYQQPTNGHWPVHKFYSPEEFQELRDMALRKGFIHVASGPLVRSSYRAALAQARASSLNSQPASQSR